MYYINIIIIVVIYHVHSSSIAFITKRLMVLATSLPFLFTLQINYLLYNWKNGKKLLSQFGSEVC